MNHNPSCYQSSCHSQQQGEDPAYLIIIIWFCTYSTRTTHCVLATVASDFTVLSYISPNIPVVG